MGLWSEGDLKCFDGFLPLEVNGWENDKHFVRQLN